jgi:uncharacterized membrane protein (DUF4010 family)
MTPEAQGLLGIAIAALGGLAIGFERQWSGHALGPEARFGGIRTFTLLGAFAGIAGWLWLLGALPLAAVLAAGGVAIVVAGYAAASRHDTDGTTEVAALVVIASGILAGAGYRALASGIVAVTALLLVEKSRLHAAVRKIDDAELRAAIRFAVMAVVVLPLLPDGPFGPLGGVHPRQLWILVLFFSGLSFLGYITRRAVGERHGYAIAGLLGGIVSSTSVVLTFSRASREKPRPALAFGVLAACTVMYVRVLIATAVLNLSLMFALLPYLAAPFLASLGFALLGLRRGAASDGTVEGPANPLGLKAALQLAGLFQIVLFAVHGARQIWGDLGLAVSGAILGLTDMDALTISMAKTAGEPSAIAVAAQAIALGVLSNTLFKMVIALVIGRGTVRSLGSAALGAAAIASAASLILLH